MNFISRLLRCNCSGVIDIAIVIWEQRVLPSARLNFLSRMVRDNWLSVASVPLLSLIAALLEENLLASAPERFPEAANAFLYTIPFSAGLSAICAVAASVIGLWQLFKIRKQKEPEKNRAVLLPLAASMLLAIVTVPLLWFDSRSYDALTDNGLVGRNYWNGAIETELWSSLRGVELDCRLNRPPYGAYISPSLFIRFADGRSLETPINMRAFGTTKAAALTHLVELGAKNQAPLSWRRQSQHEQFRGGAGDLAICVDSFLGHFPAERRSALLGMLN